MADPDPVDGQPEKDRLRDLFSEMTNGDARPLRPESNGNTNHVASVVVETVSNFLTLVNWRNAVDWRPQQAKSAAAAMETATEPGLVTVRTFLSAVNWRNEPTHPRLGVREDEPGEVQTIGTEFLAENLMNQFVWD